MKEAAFDLFLLYYSFKGQESSSLDIYLSGTQEFLLYLWKKHLSPSAGSNLTFCIFCTLAYLSLKSHSLWPRCFAHDRILSSPLSFEIEGLMIFSWLSLSCSSPIWTL